MSILKFVLEIILPLCVRWHLNARSENCADLIVHCVVVLLLLQRDTSFAIWGQTFFEVAFEIILHLKVA